MSYAPFPENCSPLAPKSELAQLIVRVLAEAGPMQMKELKRRLMAAGSPRILQATIGDAIRYDLRGEVIRRGDEWGLPGDSR